MTMDESMVVRLANLACVQLAPGEAASLAPELDDVLGWIDRLATVDTENVEPMTMVIPTRLVWHEDKVSEGGDVVQLLANAPQAAHGFFTVPKVIE